MSAGRRGYLNRVISFVLDTDYSLNSSSLSLDIMVSPEIDIGATDANGNVLVKSNGTPKAGNTINDNNENCNVPANKIISDNVTPNTDNVLLEPSEISQSVKDTVRKLTMTDEFIGICSMALTDPTACALRMKQIVKDDANAMVEIANVCAHDTSIGHVGTRKQIKSVAKRLVDMVLEKDENHVLAIISKGEMLIPRHHIWSGDDSTPLWICEEAFELFCKADKLGSREGRFLRGRWLVAMSAHHKCQEKTNLGRQLVEQAANAGCARAYTFLAQCLEFAGKYGWGKKNGVVDKELIIEYYRKAADLGDGDAMNDMGSSYATGYGGLPHDFDAAASYYLAAIKSGCLTAFDNLGTHYEAGMSGEAVEKINYEKAWHYYKMGAKKRCSKCAYNMAAAYEEGMGEIVPKNSIIAEQYYKYCIILAEEDNDAAMANRALKDLVALYIARIKLNMDGDICVRDTRKRLRDWLSERMIAGTLNDVDRCLEKAVRIGNETCCIDMLGECNGIAVYNAAKRIVAQATNRVAEKQELGLRNRKQIRHMFGNCAKLVVARCVREGSAKRRRTR